MAWTKEKPKVEGFYWLKAAGELSGKEYIHPVHVYKLNKEQEYPETVFSDGTNFSINHDLFLEWWDQPITLHENDEEYFRAVILNKWSREKTIKFAKHLLGDECQNKFHCPKT